MNVNEKPRFWDFYRAMRAVKKDDIYLNVYSRETLSSKIYYLTDKMQSKGVRFIGGLIFGVLFIVILLLPDEHICWPNSDFDANLINALISLLINIAVYRYIYSKAEFEEVPEEEWINSRQAKRKQRKKLLKILNYVFAVLAAAIFFNTYFFTYLRYAYEGGARVSSANVSIEMPETIIKLDNTTPEGAPFNAGRLPDNKNIRMKIELARVPEEASIYLNGKYVEEFCFRRFPHYFWEDDYFRSHAYCFSDTGDYLQDNTLEIRTRDFSKVWTFALEFERQ